MQRILPKAPMESEICIGPVLDVGSGTKVWLRKGCGDAVFEKPQAVRRIAGFALLVVGGKSQQPERPPEYNHSFGLPGGVDRVLAGESAQGRGEKTSLMLLGLVVGSD